MQWWFLFWQMTAWKIMAPLQIFFYPLKVVHDEKSLLSLEPRRWMEMVMAPVGHHCSLIETSSLNCSRSNAYTTDQHKKLKCAAPLLGSCNFWPFFIKKKKIVLVAYDLLITGKNPTCVLFHLCSALSCLLLQLGFIHKIMAFLQFS